MAVRRALFFATWHRQEKQERYFDFLQRGTDRKKWERHFQFFALWYRQEKTGTGIFNFFAKRNRLGKQDRYFRFLQSEAGRENGSGIFLFFKSEQLGKKGVGIFNFCKAEQAGKNRNSIFSFLHYGTGGGKTTGQSGQAGSPFCIAAQAGKWEMVANNIK
ncbi:hypothetical protein P421_06040 [Heyndrickxia coagulans P38]|jgi:hypothetical protein|nr:hypothetical protein P421_06040 [Heyndrickxia coagulans P38]